MRPGDDNFNPLENTHALSAEAIAELLQTNPEEGLGEMEAKKRILKFGLNSYQEQKQKAIFLILLEQFKSPIILLLVFAGGLSFFFQQWIEGASIIGVILITALLGFLMEFQARKSMKALKDMDVSFSKVLRNGIQKEITSQQLVPGDILLLDAGDVVPADGRLIEVNQFEADESALTGESLQVAKNLKALAVDTEIFDRSNMVFKGTFIVKGNGIAIVTQTGLFTELGKISSLVEHAKPVVTPLEKKLQELTTKLMWITSAFAIVFIGTGFLYSRNIYAIVETALALAVAAIPEGLPVVSTIALTYGMLRMAKRNVLIKRLASVETLGGISVIFTDKTGTLTENKMEVNSLVFYDEEISVVSGTTTINHLTSKNQFGISKLLAISTLCNNAVIKTASDKEKNIGDPLEIALLQFVASMGVNAGELASDYFREAEQAFSSEAKLMATLHKGSDAYFVAAKGAAEELILKCTSFCAQGSILPLSDADKSIFLTKAEEMQARGSRVLAFAFRDDPLISTDHFLEDLTLAGFIAFLDPPRLEVIEALKLCRAAGIKVIMITGDHPATALHIAEKIRLSEVNNIVINGKELSSASPQDDLFAATIFARVSPKQKLEMVSLYQKRGDVVAMTGDGINDAPALKEADIGIAMGLRGTQVAKETAAMILKDDSFTSIVAAIEQGRIIFQNIKRFLVYLLSCNLSEILIVFLYGLFNFPFTILPLQILFLNLVTDIFPALALGVGKGNTLVMKRLPRNPKDPIIANRDWITIIEYGLLITLPIILVTGYAGYVLGYNAQTCNNITFMSLAFSQLWHVFNLSSRKISFLRNEITMNGYVWSALVLCSAIILCFYWVWPLRAIVGLTTLPSTVWFIIAATSFTPIVLIQVLKRVFKVIE